MPRITVIELYRYRYWTEKLGFDREWIIQSSQAELYSTLQKLFSKNDGLLIPLRFDYYLGLSNTISRKKHEEIFTAISTSTPVQVRMVSIAHEYPSIAQLLATYYLATSTRNFIYIEGKEDPTIILHIDVDNITRLTYETSIYETYTLTMKFFTEVANIAYRYGGIAGYLGGDNIIAILPLNSYKEFMNSLPDYVKIGIGISYRPRKAMELATRALDEIRRKRKKRFIEYYDVSSIQE